MRRFLILAIFPLLFLTGCGSDSLADRLYTQAIGLSGQGTLRFTMQSFGDEKAHTVSASGIPEALRKEESAAGGRVFIGHTELLCLDGSRTLDSVQELLLEEGLSPSCKILLTPPEAFLGKADCTEAVHTLRMAEQNGLLAKTELSGILDEWLGNWETALVPVPCEDMPGLALLRKNGEVIRLQQTAAAGLFWLRRNTGNFTLTLPQDGETVNVEIGRTFLTKTVSDGELRYAVRIRTVDCPEPTKQALQEKVLSECQAALQALQHAKADVIGMQDALEAAGVQTDAFPQADVTVTVE